MSFIKNLKSQLKNVNVNHITSELVLPGSVATLMVVRAILKTAASNNKARTKKEKEYYIRRELKKMRLVVDDEIIIDYLEDI